MVRSFDVSHFDVYVLPWTGYWKIERLQWIPFWCMPGPGFFRHDPTNSTRQAHKLGKWGSRENWRTICISQFLDGWYMYIYKWYIYIYVSQLLKEKYGWVGWVIAISNDLLGSLDVIHVPPLWSDDLWCFQVRCRFKILGTDLTHLGPEVFLSSTSTLFVLGYSSWQWDLAKNRLMTWDGEGYVCHIIRCQFLGRLEITSRSCLLDLASICDCNLLLYNVRIYIYIYLQITVYDIILSLQRRTFTSWSFSRLIEAHGAKNLRRRRLSTLPPFPSYPHRTFDSGEVLYPRDQFDAGLDVSSDTICDVMRRLWCKEVDGRGDWSSPKWSLVKFNSMYTFIIYIWYCKSYSIYTSHNCCYAQSLQCYQFTFKFLHRVFFAESLHSMSIYQKCRQFMSLGVNSQPILNAFSSSTEPGICTYHEHTVDKIWPTSWDGSNIVDQIQ